MYTITKDVYFCYGHRLMAHPGKCRHLHGHSVKAAITVAAPALNEQGMVCDFADISAVAHRYIDTVLSTQARFSDGLYRVRGSFTVSLSLAGS